MDKMTIQAVIKFGATFFGVVLALWTGECMRRRNDEKEMIRTKIRIVEAIDLELELNMGHISKDTYLDAIPIISFPHTRNALDSSIGGHEFSKLDPDFQKAISMAYIAFYEAEKIQNEIFSKW